MMGSRIRVSRVAVSRPPTTTVASGRCTSAPGEVLKAMGKNPSISVRAVRITGRRRRSVPRYTRRNTLFIPSPLSSLKKLIRTTPFRTAIPNRAMKPTAAEMLKGIPRNHRVNTPPMAARGTAENTSSDCFNEPNNAYRRVNINPRTSGTTHKRRLFALCRFSYSPS